MASTDVNISNEAIRKATGRDWAEWFAMLDEAGAESMKHRDIARMLIAQGWIDEKDSWWAQSVTVGYEYARGRRVKGQTADAGFEVGVQRTISTGAAELWHFMMSIDGLRLWIGDVDKALTLEVGAAYRTKDGTQGEIRSLRQNERIRLTWQPEGWPKPSTLQLYFQDKGEKTALRLHHEKLLDADHRAEMKEHWQSVLSSIRNAV